MSQSERIDGVGVELWWKRERGSLESWKPTPHIGSCKRQATAVERVFSGANMRKSASVESRSSFLPKPKPRAGGMLSACGLRQVVFTTLPRGA